MTALTHRRPARRNGVVLHRSMTGTALVDPANHKVHLVNYTAAAIWDLCDGRTEPGEMIEAVCDLSGMPADVVEEDIVRVLSDFDRAKIIVWMER